MATLAACASVPHSASKSLSRAAPGVSRGSRARAAAPRSRASSWCGSTRRRSSGSRRGWRRAARSSQRQRQDDDRVDGGRDPAAPRPARTQQLGRQSRLRRRVHAAGGERRPAGALRGGRGGVEATPGDEVGARAVVRESHVGSQVSATIDAVVVLPFVAETSAQPSASRPRGARGRSDRAASGAFRQRRPAAGAGEPREARGPAGKGHFDAQWGTQAHAASVATDPAEGPRAGLTLKGDGPRSNQPTVDHGAVQPRNGCGKQERQTGRTTRLGEIGSWSRHPRAGARRSAPELARRHRAGAGAEAQAPLRRDHLLAAVGALAVIGAIPALQG